MKTARMSAESLSIATLTAAVVLGLATAARPAVADTGSTDIYRNQFQQSFGPAAAPVSAAPSIQTTGSTDLWGNGFGKSFPGTGGSVAQSVYANGSTDLWGNGFRSSFGPATQQTSGLQSAGVSSSPTLR